MRLFFVSDVHGSDVCFRKFVNAGRFYGVDALVLGGDVTGKAVVPIVRQRDGTLRFTEGDGEQELRSPSALDDAMRRIRDSGRYPYVTEPKEMEDLSAKPELVHALFLRLMKESLGSWIRLADERLSGTGVACYISPGNDDCFEIDEVLHSGKRVVDPEGKVVQIGAGHEMITVGYANLTPWKSPREADENTLGSKISAMADKVDRMDTAVFNLHVPPIDTALDQAPKLDKDLKPVISGGGIVMASAGSSAVRESIVAYQPLMGIHGHIHESKGVAKIGRTTCFNPGSEYGAGILRGLLCELDGSLIKSYLLTSG